MGYSSQRDGFVAQEQTADGSRSGTVVRPRGGVRPHSTDVSFDQASVESLEVASQCEEKACYECAFSSFASIVGCGVVCVLSVPTIAGIVVCIGCALGASIWVGVECYQCYKTC